MDQVQKFLTIDKSARIISVDLKDAWDDSLYDKNYPAPLPIYLGQLTCACILLAANIKFEGSVILQIQSDGAVSLAVVECTSDFKIRSTVKLNDKFPITDSSTFTELINHNNSGRFSVILDPKDKTQGQKPYIGVVEILGDSISENLSHYMKQSEQLDSLLYLAANSERATGLLIQRLPESGGGHEISSNQAQETWDTLKALASTINSNEMLQINSNQLLDRLFWEQKLLEHPAESVIWYCPCSKYKVGDMLRMLGQSEIESILKERNNIEVSCHFCGKIYNFDAVDAAQLFIDSSKSTPQENPKTTH